MLFTCKPFKTLEPQLLDQSPSQQKFLLVRAGYEESSWFSRQCNRGLADDRLSGDASEVVFRFYHGTALSVRGGCCCGKILHLPGVFSCCCDSYLGNAVLVCACSWLFLPRMSTTSCWLSIVTTGALRSRWHSLRLVTTSSCCLRR